MELGLRPNKYGIMQLLFGGTFNYITNHETGKLETREFSAKPMGIRFFFGEEITYLLKNQYENLLNDFSIFNDIYIPANEYNW